MEQDVRDRGRRMEENMEMVVETQYGMMLQEQHAFLKARQMDQKVVQILKG